MKKVAILLADGFEEIEGLATADILIRADIKCDLVSVDSKELVQTAHGKYVKADKGFYDMENYDMLILPGGMPGATNLGNNIKVLDILKKYNNENKYIAAICASPAIVLPKAGVSQGKNITSYPGMKDTLLESNYLEDDVVVDGNLITSRGPGTTFSFAYKIAEILGKNTNQIKLGMLYKN